MTLKGLDKLRMLFAQEAEQRLARLGQLVLELERRPLDDLGEAIAEIFREVHTLKGSAAVVGFEDIGRYAHGVEEKLGQLRSGSVLPTAPIVDALLVAVDRLGSMINESVAGADVDDGANAAALDALDVAFLVALAPASIPAVALAAAGAAEGPSPLPPPPLAPPVPRSDPSPAA
ncbi:MAG: Hpt domain-containing protein, partial [Actinomycetota bacterium]|nr:Hpt domain-containing protein [Actinomycetota bacterium]